jgi:hypothetical protein
MANRTHRNESPTLPLPPPRERIDLEHFFEVASAASLRALASHVELNPQPLPPRFIPHIWVGIVASLVLPETPQLQGGGAPRVGAGLKGGAGGQG